MFDQDVHIRDSLNDVLKIEEEISSSAFPRNYFEITYSNYFKAAKRLTNIFRADLNDNIFATFPKINLSYKKNVEKINGK